MKNLITDQEELNNLCLALRQFRVITVDTEFIREKTYWPELCLIQVACEAGGAAIDPMVGLDLSPFLAILADPNITKVFHAARQDLEIFHRLMGALPHPIVDTQIMGLALGFADQMAYDRLVNAVLGRKISKGHRYTDWSKRPLTDGQLDYALADVTHLLDAYQKMQQQLEQRGRSDWLQDEYAAMLNPANYDTDPETAWQRVKGRHDDARVLGRIKAMAAWREREAQRKNLPRQWMMKDEVLTELVLSAPRDMHAIRNIRGLNKMDADKAAELLELLQNAPPLHVETQPNPEAPPEAVVELLRVLLRHVAESERINPRLLASPSDLNDFAVGRPCPLDSGWRADIFGKPARALQEGSLHLGIESGRLRLFPREA